MLHSAALLRFAPLALLASCQLALQVPLADAAPTRLPAPVAAYLCAEAFRGTLPDADPLPFHGDAPASYGEDGSYAIDYERRGDGRWMPCTNGRLHAERADAEPCGMAVEWHRALGLGGWARPVGRVHVGIAPAGEWCRVTLDSTGEAPAGLVAHLRAALAFGTSLSGDQPAAPCCARHSRWAAISFVRRAERHLERGELLEARRALHVARSFDRSRAGLDAAIGRLDAALGQDELAAPRLGAAARLASDPALRAEASLRADESVARLAEPSRGQRLRRDAHRRLTAGDEAGAAALALQAFAEAPDPIADLRLRHRLQVAGDDPRGALGTALLLREYGPGQGAEHLVANDLAQVGCTELARRAATRASGHDLPAAALLAALGGGLGDFGSFSNAAYGAESRRNQQATPAR